MKKYAFCKYVDYFGVEHFVIWTLDDYSINLFDSTILFQSDDFSLVDNFITEYFKL